MRHTTMGRLKTSAVAAAKGASALPLLPYAKVLARQLKDIHSTMGPDGAEVWLYCQNGGYPLANWAIGYPGYEASMGGPKEWPHADHSERIPPSTAPFDAAGACRRLLCEARLAGFKGPLRDR